MRSFAITVEHNIRYQPSKFQHFSSVWIKFYRGGGKQPPQCFIGTKKPRVKPIIGKVIGENLSNFQSIKQHLYFF